MSSNNDFQPFASRLREFITASASKGFRGPAVESGFDLLALELFKLQFSRNEFYRGFCESRRATAGTVNRWQEIPAVPALAFKEIDLSSLPPGERTAVFHSSGTTGHRPSRHFHSQFSLALYEASLLPWFHCHFLADVEDIPGQPGLQVPFLILTPPPSQASHSSLVYMFETIRQRWGDPISTFVGELDRDGAWTLDTPAAIAFLDKAVHSQKAIAVLGTAFSCVQLVDALAARNLRCQLAPGSRLLETGGYKGRSRSLSKGELYSLITSRLGIPTSRIVSEYGMSELSSQAYDGAISNLRASSGAFTFPPWTRVQVVSPETGQEVGEGQIGLVKVFDLANVYSVMAIQTEDLAVPRGAGFELAGRAQLAERRGCSLMGV